MRNSYEWKVGDVLQNKKESKTVMVTGIVKKDHSQFDWITTSDRFVSGCAVALWEDGWSLAND